MWSQPDLIHNHHILLSLFVLCIYNIYLKFCCCSIDLYCRIAYRIRVLRCVSLTSGERATPHSHHPLAEPTRPHGMMVCPLCVSILVVGAPTWSTRVCPAPPVCNPAVRSAFPPTIELSCKNQSPDGTTDGPLKMPLSAPLRVVVAVAVAVASCVVPRRAEPSLAVLCLAVPGVVFQLKSFSLFCTKQLCLHQQQLLQLQQQQLLLLVLLLLKELQQQQQTTTIATTRTTTTTKQQTQQVCNV